MARDLLAHGSTAWTIAVVSRFDVSVQSEHNPDDSVERILPRRGSLTVPRVAGEFRPTALPLLRGRAHSHWKRHRRPQLSGNIAPPGIFSKYGSSRRRLVRQPQFPHAGPSRTRSDHRGAGS